MTLVTKSNPDRDLGKTKLTVLQQMFCLLNPASQNVLVGCYFHLLLE
jgi:hypothetical protein